MSISVYGVKSRTNNHVESHNSHLNKSIPRGSGFFKVVAKLLLDEKRKTHDMVLLLNGCTDVFREQSNKIKKRSIMIEMAQQEIVSGKISVDEFLLRLTYRYTPGTRDMARNVDGASDCESDDGDEDEDVMRQVMDLAEKLPLDRVKRLLEMRNSS